MRFRMKPDVGEHSMILHGKQTIVKPGDTVNCEKADLGSALDKFEQLDQDTAPVSKFKITQRPGSIWWFDVMHPVTGLAINSKGLRKPDAEALAGITLEEYDAKAAQEVADAEAARLAEEARDQTGG